MDVELFHDRPRKNRLRCRVRRRKQSQSKELLPMGEDWGPAACRARTKFEAHAVQAIVVADRDYLGPDRSVGDLGTSFHTAFQTCLQHESLLVVLGILPTNALEMFPCPAFQPMEGIVVVFVDDAPPTAHPGLETVLATEECCFRLRSASAALPQVPVSEAGENSFLHSRKVRPSLVNLLRCTLNRNASDIAPRRASIGNRPGEPPVSSPRGAQTFREVLRPRPSVTVAEGAEDQRIRLRWTLREVTDPPLPPRV
jgi:hypothetical protein